MLNDSKIKFVMIFLMVSCVGSIAFCQASFQFKGTVVSDQNKPLNGASVLISSINRGDVTTENGGFVIGDLPANTYDVQISYIGYETLKRRVNLANEKPFKFQLQKSSLELEEIVVKDNYAELKKKETAVDIEIVDDEFIKQNLGGSLMKSLERLGGVTTIDIGSGQSKPVIRGLGFNRVVVVENNIKHEAQQWGVDHGLEVDQYAINNVEIIKGPMSLIYGSDAIGGIVDLKNNDIPLSNTIGGSMDLTGKSNNDFIGTSVGLFARKDKFYITTRVTILDYGDFRVPTDSVDIYNFKVPLHNNQLRNTAGYERNFHTSFGIIDKKFRSRFYVSNVRTKSGFFANAHGLEPRNVDHDVHDSSNRDILYPRQKANHFKVINRTTYWFDDWDLEIDLGYQRNQREEWSQYVQHGYMPAVFPDTLDFNPEIERQFDKEIYSANTRFSYRTTGKMDINGGINAEYKINEIGGRGFIIPSFEALNIGGFLIAKYRASENSILQAGIRYDYGFINTNQHNDWFASPSDEDAEPIVYEKLLRSEDINRSFSNLTWSVGYNYNADHHWSFRFNAGKSFRMPIAKELAANGVNYHRFSYEVGNSNLSPEISYQLDIGADYSSDKLAMGVSTFANYFSNYIYLNPTSRFDRLYGFGNQVFEYTESEVFRYGGEMYARYNVLDELEVGVVGEYVYALQLSGEKEGFTLPFAPPPSVLFNAKYHREKIGFIKNPFFSIDYRITAAQRNIVPPEEPTEGFQLVNLSLGGDILWNNCAIDVSLQIQNVFNNKYFNHTSYYRLINVPEPSRNFILNISIPFSGELLKN